VLSRAAPAFAQNTDSFFFSDEAAMTAGAVTATTNDSGAVWYNPAGLGGVKRGQVDLSASAFGLRLRQVPDALTLSYPSGPRSLDVSTTAFVSAPVAVGLVRQLSADVTLGVGLYVTLRDLFSAEAWWRGQEAVALGGATTPVRFHQRLDQSQDVSRYHAGPALGWQVTPRLRVGLSALGTYGTLAAFQQFLIDGQALAPDGTAATAYFVQSHVRAQLSYVGAQPVAGVQYEPAERWRLALALRSPEVLLHGTLRTSSVAAAALPDAQGQPGPLAAATGPTRRAFSFEIIAPPRAVAAASWGDAALGFVAAEVDYQPPLRNATIGIDQRPVWNARLGGLRHLGPRLSLGGGLFTERATDRRLDRTSFLAERVDYYGVALGAQLRTPLALVKNPQADALVLSTTVALRYALGLGRVVGASVFPLEDRPSEFRAIDVVYHEFIPYLGSSTTF
jgi:hypothetical protein